MTRYLSFITLLAFTGGLCAQQITVTNPVAGAQVPVGSRCTIAWTSQGVPPGTQLKIGVSGGTTGDQPVAAFVPVEAGQYEWLVPWAGQTGSTCRVQIKLQDEGAGVCDSPSFALVPNSTPTLLLHAPVGGEQWPVGATRSVAWEAHNLSGPLTLALLQGSNVVDTVSGIPVTNNRFHYALPAALPAGNDYRLRLTSDAEISATATSLPFSAVLQAPPPRKWTMLFYFDAAAFMQEKDTIQSFLDLGMMTPSTNINYVCQYARSPDYAITNYPWWGVKRFVMQHGITPDSSNAVQHLGIVNMTAPDTLTDFINWATENYPAEEYFLILSDHGDGWKAGLLLDEVNGCRWMSTRQLQQAITNADSAMTILGLDMCLEADTEVAYQLRHAGPQILIASQFKESRNWPYRTVFQQLQDKLPFGSLTLEGLAVLFCQAFVDSHSGPTDSGTLSAFRLNQMDALTAAVAGFADTLTTNYLDTAAVRQQAGTVSAALNQAIIYCARTKVLQQHVFGLNIYFPDQPSPDPAYSTRAVVDFGVDSHWATFLDAYSQTMTNSWIGNARAACSPDNTTIDLYWFCQAINPATNVVRLTIMSDGPGNTTPAGTSLLFTNGQVIEIQGIPLPPDIRMIPVTTNHFVRWLADAHALIANPAAAQTTVQLTGDSLLIAQFAVDKDSYTVNFITEGNGSLESTNGLTQVVEAGGNCSPVTALAAPGYAFAGWGGDYAVAANPLTLTNVQMDMTVIAFFWPAPPAISIQQAGASVILSWPAEAAAYTLESSGNLSVGPWSPVPSVSTNSVTLPISGTNQFFRLRQSLGQKQ